MCNARLFLAVLPGACASGRGCLAAVSSSLETASSQRKVCQTMSSYLIIPSSNHWSPLSSCCPDVDTDLEVPFDPPRCGARLRFFHSHSLFQQRCARSKVSGSLLKHASARGFMAAGLGTGARVGAKGLGCTSGGGALFLEP